MQRPSLPLQATRRTPGAAGAAAGLGGGSGGTAHTSPTGRLSGLAGGNAKFESHQLHRGIGAGRRPPKDAAGTAVPPAPAVAAAAAAAAEAAATAAAAAVAAAAKPGAPLTAAAGAAISEEDLPPTEPCSPTSQGAAAHFPGEGAWFGAAATLAASDPNGVTRPSNAQQQAPHFALAARDPAAVRTAQQAREAAQLVPDGRGYGHVGERLHYFYEAEQIWVNCTVKEFHPASGMHVLRCDNGGERAVDLADEKERIERISSAGPLTTAPQPNPQPLMLPQQQPAAQAQPPGREGESGQHTAPKKRPSAAAGRGVRAGATAASGKVAAGGVAPVSGGELEGQWSTGCAAALGAVTAPPARGPAAAAAAAGPAPRPSRDPLLLARQHTDFPSARLRCLVGSLKKLMPRVRSVVVSGPAPDSAQCEQDLATVLGSEAPPYVASEQSPAEYLQRLMQWGTPAGASLGPCIKDWGAGKPLTADMAALHAAGCFPEHWPVPMTAAGVRAANRRAAADGMRAAPVAAAEHAAGASAEAAAKHAPGGRLEVAAVGTLASAAAPAAWPRAPLVGWYGSGDGEWQRRLSSSSCNYHLSLSADLYQELAGRPPVGEEDVLQATDADTGQSLTFRYRHNSGHRSYQGSAYLAWLAGHNARPGDLVAFRREGGRLLAMVKHVPAGQAGASPGAAARFGSPPVGETPAGTQPGSGPRHMRPAATAAAAAITQQMMEEGSAPGTTMPAGGALQAARADATPAAAAPASHLPPPGKGYRWVEGSGGWWSTELSPSACMTAKRRQGMSSAVFKQVTGREPAVPKDALVLVGDEQHPHTITWEYRPGHSCLQGRSLRDWVAHTGAQAGDTMAIKRQGIQLLVKHIPADREHGTGHVARQVAGQAAEEELHDGSEDEEEVWAAGMDVDAGDGKAAEEGEEAEGEGRNAADCEGALMFEPHRTASVTQALAAPLPLDAPVHGCWPLKPRSHSWRTVIAAHIGTVHVGRLDRQQAAVAADVVLTWRNEYPRGGLKRRPCTTPNLPGVAYSKDAALMAQLRQIDTAEQMRQFLVAVLVEQGVQQVQQVEHGQQAQQQQQPPLGRKRKQASPERVPQASSAVTLSAAAEVAAGTHADKRSKQVPAPTASRTEPDRATPAAPPVTPHMQHAQLDQVASQHWQNPCMLAGATLEAAAPPPLLPPQPQQLQPEQQAPGASQGRVLAQQRRMATPAAPLEHHEHQPQPAPAGVPAAPAQAPAGASSRGWAGIEDPLARPLEAAIQRQTLLVKNAFADATAPGLEPLQLLASSRRGGPALKEVLAGWGTYSAEKRQALCDVAFRAVAEEAWGELEELLRLVLDAME